MLKLQICPNCGYDGFLDIEKLIKIHKIITAEISDGKHDIKKDDAIFMKQQITGEELSLVLSGFKCEKCKTEKELTWHHMIERINERYVDFNKYFSQRRYYQNIAIMCRGCHSKINGMKRVESMEFIPEEKIQRLKEKWLRLKITKKELMKE